jgi:hypothetical protein
VIDRSKGFDKYFLVEELYPELELRFFQCYSSVFLRAWIPNRLASLLQRVYGVIFGGSGNLFAYVIAQP